jgi:hypothetical protein
MSERIEWKVMIAENKTKKEKEQREDVSPGRQIMSFRVRPIGVLVQVNGVREKFAKSFGDLYIPKEPVQIITQVNICSLLLQLLSRDWKESYTKKTYRYGSPPHPNASRSASERSLLPKLEGSIPFRGTSFLVR